MSVRTATDVPVTTPRRDRLGYALATVSFLIWGSIGVLVRMTDMPASALIVARMSIAAAVVALLFARRPMLAELRDLKVARLLLVMGAFSAATLLMFFIALRLTDVAIAMFLLFTGPVYVALLAPRLLGQRADRVVYPAVAVAVAGMAVMLLPGLVGAHKLSTIGVLCALATGLTYTGYALSTKLLTRTTRSVTIALSEMVLDTVILLPLAVWQLHASDFSMTLHDLWVVLVLALVCTAAPYVMFVESIRRIRVEHASILGYLEPVSAPFYALLLLGETTAATTIAGGVLIVAAGVLVVVFGSPEAEVGDVVPT
ncbi:MAG TPA: DMT family transporter [Thermoleophilia bacterium]|nr:DMT family transporter [Thermoleophilia bacterium]